jgi:hypothetical protein
MPPPPNVSLASTTATTPAPTGLAPSTLSKASVPTSALSYTSWACQGTTDSCTGDFVPEQGDAGANLALTTSDSIASGQAEEQNVSVV